MNTNQSYKAEISDYIYKLMNEHELYEDYQMDLLHCRSRMDEFIDLFPDELLKRLLPHFEYQIRLDFRDVMEVKTEIDFQLDARNNIWFIVRFGAYGLNATLHLSDNRKVHINQYGNDGPVFSIEDVLNLGIPLICYYLPEYRPVFDAVFTLPIQD